MGSSDQLTSTLASVNRMIGAARNTVKIFAEVLHHQCRIAGASTNIHTSTASFSDPKDSDQISMAKKVDSREAAARKAAEEATRRALEKKKLEDEKTKKEND